jgi:hypothetical protein
VRNPDGAGWEGIYLSSGAVSADNMVMCADLQANTIAGSGTAGAADLGISKRFGTQLRLPGFTNGGDLQTYVRSRNAGSPTAATYDLTPDAFAGTCTAPALPA